MIIVMKKNATEAELEAVKDAIIRLGYKPHAIQGVERTVIGAVGHEDKTPLQILEQTEGVEAVIPILKPWKLVSRDIKPERSVVDVDGVIIGGKEITIIAGPCSVESEEQIIETAQAVRAAGAKILRGGAYKPRTSPYAFQGLEITGLKLLAQARSLTGLKIVTEIVSVSEIDLICEYSDMIQIGARNCQNYALLKRVGQTRLPVLLKRGMATTVKEFLMSAEYIMSQGNYQVVLCERGIRTFEDSTRFTLDLNCVPVLNELTHLPVIVDPSHGTGNWRYVTPMGRAAIAAGADGLTVEVHPNPREAFSDGPQSLKPEKFTEFMSEVRKIALAMGRDLAIPKI
ncbi:MAG: Phospho-2-dehydro-3-deoxyheptonate aldolase [candidate division BRC1 bacterium ADurb.Bin183]|nr:MAG: Phospho-2-dehydro-3-deoxyheptonate aldolase [candidate division BRC1 bacterium ADurb.Bin183]